MSRACAPDPSTPATLALFEPDLAIEPAQPARAPRPPQPARERRWPDAAALPVWVAREAASPQTAAPASGGAGTAAPRAAAPSSAALVAAGVSVAVITPRPPRPPRPPRTASNKPGTRTVGLVTSNQVAAPARPPVQLTSETCTSLLRVNDAPELPFALSINPYRGCEHACVFCPVAPVAAAASGSGPDGADAASATVIYAKSNAAERLRIELRRPGYRARPICLGSAADAYQPVERQQRLTRALIEVLAQARHPFGLTTRSAGVVRDLDLLAPLAEQGLVLVLISLSTLDPWLAARLEPGASLPAQRLAAMRSLARAGVWVGLNLAPLLPGVNDDDGLEALIAAAAQAGARAVRWQGLGIGVGVGAALQILQHGEAHRVDDDAWRSSVAERVRSATLGAGLSSELPQLDTSLFQLPSAPEQPGERGHSQKSLF